MSRPSSIDKLDPQIREEINRLRNKGHSIDQILAKLREMEVVHISRSSVGRYVKSQEKIGERLRRMRVISEAIVRERGEEPASRSARLNIELLHTVIFDLFGMVEGEDNAAIEALKSDPKAIHDLSKALDHLTRSAKSDADYEKLVKAQVRAEMEAENEERLQAAVKEKGLTPETAEVIRKKVLGLK